jgi:sec-independent protein translocase protein TatA
MFGSSEMVIVLVIVLVLFGGSQLPKLAKNLGKAQKEFKDGMADADTPKAQADAAAAAQVAATPPPPAAPAPVADPPAPPIA